MKKLHSYLIVLFCLLTGDLCFAQQINTDSLEKCLRSTKNDADRIKILAKLCWGLEDQGDLAKAKAYADQALSLSKKIDFKEGIATSYNELGIIYLYQSDFPSALTNYKASLKIREEMKDKKNIATIYSNIGMVYMYQGNIPLALKNDFDALRIREEVGDKKGMGDCYNNIGIIYMDQNNLTEALKNYLSALKIEKEIGNKEGEAGTYLNVGLIKVEQGLADYSLKNKITGAQLFSEALTDYREAMKIMEGLGNKKGMADGYHNIGNLYFQQGKLLDEEGAVSASAEKYQASINGFFSSVQLKTEIGDKQGLADSYANLGDVYLQLKEHLKAKEVFEKALALSKETGSKKEISVSCRGLSEVHQQQGNFKMALEFYQSYIVYRDSLSNEENTKKTVESQMQYDFDKQQAADSIKNMEQTKQENLKHDQEIKQQRLYTYGGAIGFLLMLIVAGVSFRAYRQKQKTNEIITEQKNLVDEKQKEILDSIHYAKRIQSSLLPTEKYIERNLKRLKE